MSKGKRQTWGKWILRILIAVLIAVPLLFLLSNLALRTSWGREAIAKQLGRRTPGLSWQLASASWSPWKGFELAGLQARIKGAPPETPDFLSVDRTSVEPYWGESLKGKPIFREVEVDSPQLNLPLELLFVTRQPPPLTPPPVADAQPARPPAKEKSPPQAKPKKPKKKPAKPKESAKPTPQEKPVEAPPELGKWVRIRNAGVTLYSLRGPSIEVKGLNFDAPLAGPDAAVALSWAAIDLSGKPLWPAGHLDLEWKERSWILPAQEVALAGVKTRLGGHLGIRQKGLPFRFQLAMPQQDLPEIEFDHKSRAYLSAGQMACALSAAGQLTRVDTWQFDLAGEAYDIHGGSHLREFDHRFDSGRVRLSLRNQIVSCPSIELRSEEFSLLGNGQLALTGHVLAVLRLVTSPHYEERMTNIAIGSFLSQGWTSHWMKPLETPDRYYRDLHLKGQLPDKALVDTGRRGEFIPLATAFQHLERFRDQEVNEEPRPPSP
ncbi:MAG: hypothetical protein Q7Q71_11550 [Verrucomicrobiota bacterium JB023]|nr:hypothetical protein [Verrucomicrobiota bacterium JB023]